MYVTHFGVDQDFVQSKLSKDVFLRLPKGYGSLSGTVVRSNKSLYGFNQALWSRHARHA